MFDTSTLLAYVAAAALLVLIPGPGTAWILAQSMAGGTRRGAQAAVGLETATLIHALAAGLGLSTVLATSALAFEIVKYAGAAYLVWLGIKAWREGDAPGAAVAAPAAASARQVYLRSVATGVLNPKVAVFFLAFLPQFVEVGRGHVAMQVAFLGIVFTLLGLISDGCYAFAAGTLGDRLRHSRAYLRFERYVSGVVFIGLGVTAAFAGNHRK